MVDVILKVFVDGMMALLLVLTIYYCWRLNLRIKVLQDSKSELAQVIQQFDESTKAATRGIAEIHKATTRIAENIQHKIDKANYIADDLQFMIEKGSKVADRMDGGIASRPAARQTPPPSSRRNERPSEEDVEKVNRARELLEAGNDSEFEETKVGKPLESVLKRVSKRSDTPMGEMDGDANALRRKRPGARLRTKSEQDVLESLKRGEKV
ncbi:MAG: DUF6468 domain-containing protein [Rickettsiales bacterium]|nr:DUF6468 domain-containing protein [Rickettsiales bacterium]